MEVRAWLSLVPPSLPSSLPTDLLPLPHPHDVLLPTQGLLTYLDEEEEEEGEEEGEEGHVHRLLRKEEGVRLEANEETERSGLHALVSLPPLAAFSPSLPQLSFPPAPPPFPVAYTSKDTTVRPRRVGASATSRKRPRGGTGGGGGRGVRWADAALLEEVFPFFMDRPVGR